MLKYLVLALLLIAIVGFVSGRNGSHRSKRPAYPVGDFSIVTRTGSFTTGWNEGGLRRRSFDTYFVHYRGKPFHFEGRGGMMGDETHRYHRVNAVVTFESREKALIVNVGDPNNNNDNYLLRSADDGPEIRYLGQNSGHVRVALADHPGPGDHDMDGGMHRFHVTGGRWMLLGPMDLIDLESLDHYQLVNDDYRVNLRRPLGMSPDRRSIVRAADNGNFRFVVAVCDFRAGMAYSLAVDRALMRFSNTESIDAAWIDHHFEWVASENGSDRLQPRSDFAPLPFQGVLTPKKSEGDTRSYYIEYALPTLRDAMAEFVIDELLGKPMRPDPHDGNPRVEFDGTVLTFVYHREAYTEYVALRVGFGEDRSPIELIGKSFDRHLATGALDKHFISPGADSNQ